jgi:phosphoribosylformylglycinamidine cyclo-ligase
LLAGLGSVDADEMEHVFNMGVGMTAVVAAADADDAIGLLAERGVPAWPLGNIVSGTGRARLTGRHP